MLEITVNKKDVLVPTLHDQIFIISERGADCDSATSRHDGGLCGNQAIFYFDYGPGYGIQLCTRHAKPTARANKWIVDWNELIKQSRKVRR